MTANEINQLIDDLDTYLELLNPGILKATARFFHRRLTHNRDRASKEGIRGRIEKVLRDRDTKILVVVDDLDRLSSRQIRETFQLVATIADFRGVNYLMLYDHDIVSNALEDMQGQSGDRYLEKIVQMPIEIPKLSSAALESLFSEFFASILDEYGKDDVEEAARRLLSLRQVASSGLASIRNLKRLGNTYEFKRNALGGRVDLIDVLALELLRTLSPSAYSWIKSNRFQLCLSGKWEEKVERKTEDERMSIQVRCQERFSDDTESANYCLGIISLLFFDAIDASYIQNETRAQAHTRKRVFDIDYFESFLTNDICEEQEAVDEISSLVDSNNWHDLEKYIVYSSISGRYGEVIGVLGGLAQNLNDLQSKGVVVALAKCIVLADRKNVHLSENTRTVDVIDTIAGNINNRHEFIVELFTQLDVLQVAAMADFVVRRCRSHEVYGFAGGTYEELVDLPTLANILDIFIEAMESMTTSSELFELVDTYEQMTLWRNANPDSFLKTVKELEPLARRMLVLSEAFVGSWHTMGMSDVVSRYAVDKNVECYLTNAYFDGTGDLLKDNDDFRQLPKRAQLRVAALLEYMSCTDRDTSTNEVNATDAERALHHLLGLLSNSSRSSIVSATDASAPAT